MLLIYNLDEYKCKGFIDLHDLAVNILELLTILFYVAESVLVVVTDVSDELEFGFEGGTLIFDIVNLGLSWVS